MKVRFLLAAAAIVATAAAIRYSAVSVDLEGHIARETTRLREHFDAIDSALRARDVTALSAEARARRAKLIEWLRDYRNEGQFPLNDGYAEASVPIFRDRDGTLCAMAYLIERSGRGDIVDRIASSRNLARIAELVDDPDLVAWLDEWGLTADEAARIQPAYGPVPPLVDDDDDVVDGGYALGSMALASTSLVTSYVNVADATPWSITLGILTGGASVIMGAAEFDEDGATRNIALANSAVGAFTIGAALYGWYSSRSDLGPVSSPVRVGSAELTLSPEIISVADRASPGIVFRARF